jgi:hypothetical protein
MRTRAILSIAIVSISASALTAFADFTLVLKNGRRITAQSYREEGSTIKVHGLGGEFGIPKDQIQTILKADQSEQRGLSISDLEASSRQTQAPAQKPSVPPARDAKDALVPSEKKSLVEANEEQEYQKRLAEVTQKLETAKREYLNATQGGGTSSNVSKEGFGGWVADLGSRIRDSQNVPGGGGPASTPPMQGYEAPVYTPKEKELSNLRSQIDSLQKERDSLIQEMKSKNIPTATP